MNRRLALLGIILLSSGCASAAAPGGAFSSPSGTVEFWIRSAIARDADGFRSAFIERSRIFLEKNETVWKIVWKQAQTYKEGFKIAGEEITGECATVILAFDNPRGGPPVQDKKSLVRETAGAKPGWKINIDFPAKFQSEIHKQESEGIAGCALVYEAIKGYLKITGKYPSGFDAMIRTGLLDPRFSSGDWVYYHYIYKKGEDGKSFKLQASPMGNAFTDMHFFLDQTGVLHASDGMNASAEDPAIPEWYRKAPPKNADENP
jgi:hypothetical protein